jgi:hypothetical protein
MPSAWTAAVRYPDSPAAGDSVVARLRSHRLLRGDSSRGAGRNQPGRGLSHDTRQLLLRQLLPGTAPGNRTRERPSNVGDDVVSRRRPPNQLSHESSSLVARSRCLRRRSKTAEDALGSLRSRCAYRGSHGRFIKHATQLTWIHRSVASVGVCRRRPQAVTWTGKVGEKWTAIGFVGAGWAGPLGMHLCVRCQPRERWGGRLFSRNCAIPARLRGRGTRSGPAHPGNLEISPTGERRSR